MCAFQLWVEPPTRAKSCSRISLPGAKFVAGSAVRSLLVCLMSVELSVVWKNNTHPLLAAASPWLLECQGAQPYVTLCHPD